ncbi:MAG: endolytic transglycosylase MltG [Chloroflexi bacterium]|nr:endolytic transglycosylase MltG [Chloroflexota bacterium]
MRTESKRRRSRSIFPLGCFVSFLLISGFAIGIYVAVPIVAVRTVGPISDRLNDFQRFQYSALILWYDGLVTSPVDSNAADLPFTIADGEDALTVAGRLELSGIIRNADAFVAYLVYAGLDTGLQAGEFQLSPAMPPIQIAQKLQDATPSQVKFVILPGWRMEEVAAAMPTSGFEITPDEFLRVAVTPPSNFDFLVPGSTAEGFLFPGEYILPRAIQAEQLVPLLMNNAALALTSNLRQGFARQNLDVYQAVILASIIQREAVVPEEQPTIASVFLNRLAAGMRLETDPTIQYALGFNADLNTWWKAPLSSDDLAVSSPYNTYQIPGLPPGPISNPALSALQAVAYPAQTPYYYFRARCDGSGLHNFSETFEQHLENGCP